MRDFKKLHIWQIAHQLTLDLYKLSVKFPREEMYCLTSQLRRAIASVPANIAEGCGHNSNADTAHFIQIAIGSLCETEYHVILAHDLGYIPDNDFHICSNQINGLRMKMIRYNEKIRSN